MKYPRLLLIVALGLVVRDLPVRSLAFAADPSGTPASSPAAQTAPADERPSRPDLSQIKQLIARGAYREALEEAELFLRLHPSDPWVHAYRTLCERRLRATEQFEQLSPQEATTLQEALAREQKTQGRAAAQAKVLERQLKREQTKWDADLKQIQQEAIREQKAKQRRQHLEERERARATKARQREQERQLRQQQHTQATVPSPPGPAQPAPPPRGPQPPAVTLPPPPVPETAISEEPEPAAPSVPPSPESAPPIPPAPEPTPPTPSAPPRPPHAVELAPITVPTGPPQEPPLVTPKPGVVQIFADQLSVLQDRRLAMAEGHVRVVFDDGELSCDKVTVFTDTKDAYAQGRVRIERGKDVFRGELAHYNMHTKKGRFFEGTAYTAPWYQYGKASEHLAEGVLRVKPGYLTSCDLEPPHFRFQGRTATVFTKDQIVRGRNVTLAVEEFPLIYLPWLSLASRQTPFFLIPGKKKPWEEFALMGYRYELPDGQNGALRMDWRRAMAWGFGVDHKINNDKLGKALLRVYYNDEHNIRRPEDDLPKGAGDRRYRVMWRHQVQVPPDTTVVTNIQEYSDADFQRELLFLDEYVRDNNPDTFVSTVTSDPNFSLETLVRKRMNRFQSATEAFPEATFSIHPTATGETQFFSESKLNVANLQSKTAHSDKDTDVVRVDWFQQLSYAMNWFRPVLLTPKAGVRQTYYTKDIQGGVERTQGERDVVSGQFSMGTDASLKLFRIFPVDTNWRGLDIHQLRHVLTPTVSYQYVHQPTIPNALLNFASASGTSNSVTFGLENKLQTRRPVGKGRFRSADLARFLISLPYTFRGNGNKRGGRLGNWSFDAEFFPWPWMRFETDWSYEPIFPPGLNDYHVPSMNVDLVLVGGKGAPEAQHAPDIAAPSFKTFEPGPQQTALQVLPEGQQGQAAQQGQWYLGFGHRYSRNDKTEDVLQFDWQVSQKWRVGTFHRFTWKEVKSGSKRFRNIREYQYVLTRDLHDWLGQLVYRVDREFGEELWFTLTLKAYPEMPIEFEQSYHQPKIGSQNSPFSPVPRSQ